MLQINCLIIVLLAAVAVSIPTPEAEKKPGHCFVYGLNIKEGGDWVPAPVGRCEKIKCEKAEFEQHMMLTCAEFIPRPECYKTKIDLTKRYPACCPHSVCPGDPDFKKH